MGTVPLRSHSADQRQIPSHLDARLPGGSGIAGSRMPLSSPRERLAMLNDQVY